jgi:hypothetical protein
MCAWGAPVCLFVAFVCHKNLTRLVFTLVAHYRVYRYFFFIEE